jgi:uncharacterized membrane protein
MLLDPSQTALYRRLTIGDETLLGLVLSWTSGAEASSRSGLDERSTALVRVAALIVAGGSGPAYSRAVDEAIAMGASPADVTGVLVAIAPITGSAHLMDAAPKLALALGYDVDAGLEGMAVPQSGVHATLLSQARCEHPPAASRKEGTMTDPVNDAAAEPQQQVEAAAGAVQPEAEIGLITDGAYYLLAGQFASEALADAAYAELEAIEAGTSLRIDGVVIASADQDGKIKFGRVTDHSTKTGLKWGVVGGAVLGIIFPPSILASAVGLGVVGSVLGKFRNISRRSTLADELEGLVSPGTTALIVFAQDEAVVEVEKALAKADRIVTKAVDKQLAAEIDREAAAAKDAIATA